MQFSEFKDAKEETKEEIKEETKESIEKQDSKVEDNLNIAEPFEVENSLLSQNPKPDIKKQFFSLFVVNLYFFFIVFGVTLLLGSILGELEPNDFNRAFAVMRTLEEVTQLDPIYSIAMVDSKVKTCPEDYDFLSIGDWMGTKSGCYDLNSDLLFPSDECDTDDYYSFAANDPAKLYYWKDSKFCVARIPQSSRIPLSECKSEHVKCQNFCTTKNYSCPFNNITVAPALAQTIKISNPDSERVKINTNRSLDLHRYKAEANKDSQQQLVGFRVGLKGYWCLDTTRASEIVRYFGSRKVVGYPLSNRAEKGCGWYGGIGGQVDVDNQKSFYKSNQLESVIQNLPLYDKFINNETVQLIPIFKGSSSFEMYSTEGCAAVSSINNNEMQEMQNVLNVLPDRVSFGKWISYIISTISALVVLCGVLYWKQSSYIRRAELTLAKILSKVTVAVLIIFIILDILILMEWLQLMKVEQWIENFIRCSIRYKQQQGRPLDDFWGKVRLSIVIVNAALAIIIGFYVYLKKKIKREDVETNRYFSSYSDLST